MLEGLAAWILNTYIGEYVENLNTTQLSIGLLQGAVELENLPLKKDALKNFDIPLQVKTGFIGKITLQIPLRRLRSEPWVISIERMYMVAGPYKYNEYNEEKTKKDEQAKKTAMLEALEKKWQVQKQEKSEGYGASWFSYGTSVAANILENLQLNVKDVHIRYEDDELIPSCPFAFGVVIKSLSAQSTDGNWLPKFVSNSLADMMFKLVDLQNFSCYLDTDAKMIGHLSIAELVEDDVLDPEMYLANSTGHYREHDYILAPVSAQTRLKRNTSALPLRSPTLPRITMDMTLEKMAFCLSEDQYRCIIQWLKEFERHDRRQKHRKWRPLVNLKENPRAWWKYAISANLHTIQERNKRRTKAFLTQRVKDLIKYHKAYKHYISGDTLDYGLSEHKRNIEEEWKFDELKIVRELAFQHAKKEGKLEKKPEEKPEAVVTSAEKPAAESKGLLQGWFPGWGGWYGSKESGNLEGAENENVENKDAANVKAEDETVGEPPPKIAKTELEQELMDVIHDTSENTSFLKKDTVFAQFNFCLSSGSFKLLCPSQSFTNVAANTKLVTLLDLECSTINMMFESRPRTRAMKFGISVAGFYLHDKFTESSRFPCLVSPQNRDRSSVFNKTLHTSTSSPQIRVMKGQDSSVNVTESVSSPQLHLLKSSEQIQEEKIFELLYEKNPVNSNANYRVSIVTKPLDIVYNPGTIRRVREFFSTKKMDTSRTSQLRLTAAARRQYEFLKEQTKAELKQTIDQILEGDESLQAAKRWDLKLDISAPQIIVPENMADEDPRMVIIDLGHLHISNKSHEVQQKEEKQSEDNDDEFQTPLSTPPSEEAMDCQPSIVSPPDLSKITLSESQLFDKLYEKYILNLSDLQVMVGKMSDNWKLARGRGSTHLHVIDKLTINLQFERRLIYTADPDWPSTTICGTMPCLTMHVNEAKVQSLRRCVEILSTPTSAGYGLDISASSSSQSLTETFSSSNLVQQDSSINPNASFTAEKKELIEDSRLLIAKFSINSMSLEVQSRGRPIVELQVTKVNAKVTKRPYDNRFGLTVHSLLVVDALQTYGRDFELLVASHKHVTLDSLSGSIRGSEVASPSSPVSPTSPHSPAESNSLNASQSSTSLKVVQEAISKTFQALMASGSKTLGVSNDQPDPSLESNLQEEEEEEALISLDLELISENSPSNSTGEGELQIITLQFNSLDIVANQETMVELLSFFKAVVPDKDKSLSSSSSLGSRSLGASQSPNISIATANKGGGHRELTAEFHRLNVLLMHLEEINGLKHAKKVATATMSSAKIQATLGKDLDLSGSLGGFHVVDVMPDMICYQQVFSVGSDSSDFREVTGGLSSSRFQPHSAMFKTANESMFDDVDSEHDSNKALTFHYSKGMQTSHTVQSFSGEGRTVDSGPKEENVANLTVHIASMCYVHSPRIIHQVSLCFTEFKDYMATFAESIKTAATEVAKEMISIKNDMSVIGSRSGMTDFNSSVGRNGVHTPLNKTQSFYLHESDESVCDMNTSPVEKVLLLNIQLETPVIVVPRKPTSSEAFVAQLGQITVKNNMLSPDESADDNLACLHRKRMIVEAKDMNLCSMDTNEDLPQGLSVSQYNKSFVQNLGDEFGVPIVYNTTVKMIMDYIQPESVNILHQEDTNAAGWCFGDENNLNDHTGQENIKVEQSGNILDVTAKIETPLKLELSKSVYEQFLQTLDNLTYDDVLMAIDAQKGNGKSESNISQENSPEAELSSVSFQSQSGFQRSNSLSKSKDISKFVTKKVHFEVPLFNVEMKGDFGEGEKGLVDLKLHSFVLKYEKNNSYTSNIKLKLKSLEMEDLLEKPDSKHRYLMVSHGVKDKKKTYDDTKVFLSSSCPDSMIVAPTPIMPRSLPSSFHEEVPPHAMLSPSVEQFPESLRAFQRPGIHTKSDRKGFCPQTPPPSLRTSRRQSVDGLEDVNALVHIDVVLVNKLSTEYTTKYDKTNRFIDVDFNSLETNVNLQTWVILLDFLGLGAKIHDVNSLDGNQKKQGQKVKSQQKKESKTEYVNTVVNLKVKSLTLTLNKPEYELTQANISEVSAHINVREGNLKMSGQLGNLSVVDCSPHGTLYKERFVTVGKQAVVFDFFKYGLPDVNMERDEDISLKLRMASVHYVHTNRFMVEVIAFVQHFLQLQDVLGRIRAASAGKMVAEKAARGSRIRLDIEANAPIILIPHSSKSSDILVMNLGNLNVKNRFLFDGHSGTLTWEETKKAEEQKVTEAHQPASKVTPKSSESSKSTGNEEKMEIPFHQPEFHMMTQSLFDEYAPPKPSHSGDLMTSSIYGSLEHDLRMEDEFEVLTCSSSQMYDPTDLTEDSAYVEGSSVDPSSPSRLTLPILFPLADSKNGGLNLEESLGSASISSGQDVTSGEYVTPMSSSNLWDTPDSARHICLLDVLAVELADMDLFSAERVNKQNCSGKINDQDLEFENYVIQKQGGRPLRERCLLKLHIERNLEGEVSHSAPDWRVKGALSSVHCSIDLSQYKLLRGILEHNLGEKLEEFKRPMMSHMQDPKNETVLSGNVWTGISLCVDLHNVTVELLIAHGAEDCPEASLARLDFLCSTLSFDAFSDQSKDVDLVSHEILAYDTRYRDAPADVCPNVFNKILQPDSRQNGSTSLQMELHYRSTLESNRFMVILNNMKLMCIFDWLLTVHEFLMTKPEDPFQKDREDLVTTVVPEEEERPLDLNASGSRAYSPLTVSQSIITKRGPIVEKVEVPFEFKLNVTDTQFVVVEDSTSWDTNAVILKTTAVLAYRPKAQDKLLSCSLQSLEVFSCSLLAEEETALSIIDPLTISIDLNANPLLDPKPVSPGGIQDAAMTQDRNLILEVSFNTMNIRLSYHDMKMFLAILNSLPKQALQATNRESRHNVSKYPKENIQTLQEMGFSVEDCEKSLTENNGNLGNAALWLTKHRKPIPPQESATLTITGVELNATCVCLCLIDDCRDSDVPLAEIAFNAIKVQQKFKPVNEGSASFHLTGDFYNRALSGWEPFLEQWRCHTEWKKSYKNNEEKTSIQINAPDVMNINITKALLEQYKKTKLTWTEDYYKDVPATSPQSSELNIRPVLSPTSQRRRVPFVPFVLHNQTGCTLWFFTVTTNPSRTVGKTNKTPKFLIDSNKGQTSDAYIQTSSWQRVAAGEKKSFVFHRREKIRHKKTHDLHINQLVVNVEGWHKLSAVSVDKVGVYFRHADPDPKSASGLAGLVYSSKHNPAKQQMVRVVFDVQQEGSARKVITVRSALMVTNKLDCAVQLRVTTGNNFEGGSQVLTVPQDESIPIPLPFITSLLYIKPRDWPVRYCDQPIQWQHVGLSGQIKDKIMKCETSDNSGVYRFCASVKRENYPEQMLGDSSVLPGHMITLLPPVVIHNLLPIDLRYYLKKSDISGTVKPSKRAALHSADPCDVMELGIYLENFGHCRELVIPPDITFYKVKLRLYDHDNRLLELTVRIVARKGGCVNLYVIASYWLVNKSGLPLIFKQDGCKTEAAGQFEEHELARSVTPLLFSYSDKESSTFGCTGTRVSVPGSSSYFRCTMRVGRSVHGVNASPHWCHRFSLESGTGMRKLYVMPRDPNRPDWVYNIGIEVRQGKGKYRDTNIVTFAPRYEIDNQSSHNLAIAQRHITQGQMVRSLDVHLTALPKCKLPFHWPRLDLDQLLCVQLLDVRKCHWSGGFRIDKINSFHINMRTDNGSSHLLKVEVVMQGPTFFIVFGDAEEMPPPFRIDNLSEVSISYHQANTEESRLKTYIKPHTSLPYAWDEPTLNPVITLSVQGGTSATYDMNKLEEGEKLYYQNFIYLTAVYTFNKPNSEENKQDLVLDCLHTSHIVFKKREHGKRSQLWRMTTGGMLEHEGSMPPRDPRKQGNTTNRLVLDISDIAPQPGKMVPLTLRKIDERRKSTQRWKFIGDRLCCGGGVLCVQALGGEDFLQDGAVAVLGPVSAKDTEPTPKHMQISSQKLCPGSGLLSVRVLMDGPIRVLQITDIRHKQLVKQQISDEESWEVYSHDDTYPSQSGKCLTRQDSNTLKPKISIALSMNLKGGLGISLVNRNAEELLYISLKNILMDYTSTPTGVKADISVANIQMDNQLFNTQRPVMLYISTTSKREAPENTPALHMAVHKTHNDKWNAEIYKHLFVTLKKMSVQLEERLLWKLLQFIDFKTSDSEEEKVDSNEYDTRKALAAATSVKSKHYYFGTLKISTSRMSLSMMTASKLSPDLQSIKKAMSIPLIKFEDAKVDLDPFIRHHPFETSTFLTNEILHHYTEELKSQAAKILGSVDFLGNPLGLFNDVTEGISGLIKDGNVGGLLKNVTHGVSNSAAKVASSLSDGLGTLNMDVKHNEKREQIRSMHSGSGGSHLVAGIKGLGYGLFGGLTSVFTQTYEGAKEEGVEGLFTGLGKGVIGTVTKPVAGVLDLASGAANAVKDTSSSTSHVMPDRVRLPRCCHGPGGLLPSFLENQAESQKMMYRLNGNKQEETFIALERLRSGKEDGLKALITSKQVYFLLRGKPDPNYVILQVSHKELMQCKTVENNKRFYIELVKHSSKGADSASSIQKRPQVRCDRQDIAQRVSQQIEYARNLFEEQRHTLFMTDSSADEDF